MQSTVSPKKLRSGSSIPVLGFATRTLTKENCYSALKTAIESGCRHIDCASFHHNEDEIGIALEKILQEGNVKRKELFITSKFSPVNFATETVRERLQATLMQLRVDYIDLYLLQDPNNIVGQRTLLQKSESLKVNKHFNFAVVWKEFEVLQREGMTRNIGLANFKDYHIETLLESCTIPPAVHQIHSKSLSEAQIEFCRLKEIVVSSYIQLRQRGTTSKSLDNDRTMVKDIASRHGKTSAQITIRSQLQHDMISVFESAKSSQIKSKFQVFDFELDAHEVKAALALDKKMKHASTSDTDFRLIDIVDDRASRHHRQWRRGADISGASDD